MRRPEPGGAGLDVSLSNEYIERPAGGRPSTREEQAMSSNRRTVVVSAATASAVAMGLAGATPAGADQPLGCPLTGAWSAPSTMWLRRAVP